MASAWARTNPGAAAKWALSYARPQERTHVENRAVKNVFLRWINNTPDEALAWWRMLPASPLRDDLGASASTYIAEGGALDLALEMVEPAAGHADPDLLGQMGQLLAARSPDEAATWLTSLPEEADTKIAAKLVMQAMYRKQPSSAAEFLTRLPRGEGRDRMITGFIEQAALQSPVEAAEWVTLIDDPHSRRDAASVIYLQWRERSPAAAQEWIRTLTGVDPEWHARFLRTMR